MRKREGEIAGGRWAGFSTMGGGGEIQSYWTPAARGASIYQIAESADVSIRQSGF